MGELQIFNYEEKAIRTVTINGEPWWVAKDVCDILNHSNSRMALESLEDDEKGVSKVYTPGGLQDVSIVNESGLYSLILKSNKPEAKKFKKWITSEVIPSIRKTGSYSIESDPAKFLAQAVQLANKLLEEQKPLVEFAQAVRDSKEGILIRDMAKALNPPTGEKRLYLWLRNNKMIMPYSTEPYQPFIDRGIFSRRENVYDGADGDKHISFTTLITGKGQQYIQQKWSKDCL